MSEQITEANLHEAIVARLEATHAEVADISGTCFTPPQRVLSPRTFPYPLSHLSPLTLINGISRSFTCTVSLAIPVTLTQKLTHPPGGCGQSFQATIVSPQFAGLASLKRHRLVNAALKDELALIHAWTARCLTPEQWAAR